MKPLSKKRTKTVETIINENGTAKKFPDGTMICYNQQKILTDIKQLWGSWYVSSMITLKNFPVAFIETPIVFFSAQLDSLSAVSILVENGATNQKPNNIVFARGESTGDVKIEIDVNMCAIGKWK